MLLSKEYFKKMFSNAGFKAEDAEALAKQFHNAKIRKAAIGMIDNDDLVALGINAIGDRKMILLWIKQNRECTEMSPDPEPLTVLSIETFTKLFSNSGFDEDDAVAFAKIFHHHRIREEILGTLDIRDFIEMGIQAVGDQILLLRSTKPSYAAYAPAVKSRPKKKTIQELGDELHDLRIQVHELQHNIRLLRDEGFPFCKAEIQRRFGE